MGSQQQDPYNWAFPQRNDLMSLSKIQNSDNGQYQRQRAITQDYRYVHTTKPIFLNKVSYSNKCDDIAGSKPVVLFQNQTQNIDRSMLDDIKGTHPQVNKFQTKRQLNPLQPDYQLPTALAPPQELYKNKAHDIMNVRDIEGTRPKKDQWYNKIRNIDPYTDIEGSKSKQRPIYKSVDRMNVTDINNKSQLKPKDNNPLEPTYNVRGSVYGFVEGSKPTNKHPNLNKDKSLSLNTNQIQGCQTNTVREAFFLNQVRKYFPETNKVNDIPGTQTGTCVKGLRTKRQVNPLNPIYNLAST